MLVATPETAITTSTDAAVPILTLAQLNKTPGPGFNLFLFNNGAAPGFFSVDGGTTWAYLPASDYLTLPIGDIAGDVLVKRIGGGTNLSGVYAFAF